MQRGHIEGTNNIHAVLNKRAFPPAQHHIAGPQFYGGGANLKVAVEVVIQKLSTLALGQVIKALRFQSAVNTVIVWHMAVSDVTLSQGIVIPIFETREQTDVVQAQLKVVHPLE